MKPSRWHSCNVLDPGYGEAHLWRFEAGGGQVGAPDRQEKGALDRLPMGLAHKDWQTLWRRKLNIAWLPQEEVFLRVLHLPTRDLGEVKAMVELQIEKVSPLPVHQILWSFEPVPRHGGDENLTTVIVVLVARDVVETFLGGLETRGFLPDCLEMPWLNVVVEQKPDTDGAWVYLKAEPGRATGLVVWWYGGVLQNVDLLSFVDKGDRSKLLRECLSRLVWGGEMDGWLKTPPVWSLVADPETRAGWQEAFRQAVEGEVRVTEPPAGEALARLSAQRAMGASVRANLLPEEYSARYRQQFIDRLWMRGLGALIGLYVVGLVVYFGAVKVLESKVTSVQGELAGLGASYTNALELRAKIEVLQEQVNLRYAALECWRVAAEHLPAELTMMQFSFQNGRILTLQGVVPADSQNQVTEYNAALKKATLNDLPLFSVVNAPSLSLNPGASATSADATARWVFTCELNRSDLP